MRKTPKVLSLIVGILNLLLVGVFAAGLAIKIIDVYSYYARFSDVSELIRDVLNAYGGALIEGAGMLLVGIQLLRRRKGKAMALGIALMAVSRLLSIRVGADGSEWATILNIVGASWFLILAVDCLCPLGSPIYETGPYIWTKFGIFAAVFLVWQGFALAFNNVSLYDLIMMLTAGLNALICLLTAAAVLLGREEMKAPQLAPQIRNTRPAPEPLPEDRTPELPHYVLLAGQKAENNLISYTYRFSTYDPDLCRKCGDELLRHAEQVTGVYLTRGNGTTRNYAPDLLANWQPLTEHPDFLENFKKLCLQLMDDQLQLRVHLTPWTKEILVEADPGFFRDTVTFYLDSAIHGALQQTAECEGGAEQ